jgi:hypothetical protein
MCLILVRLLNRIGHNMVKSYVPFPTTTFAVGIFASSYLFSNNDLRSFVISSLWAFWDTGSPFGIRWIGKAYFVVTFFVSIIVTWLFGLFRPGSSSKEVLRYSLKLIAILMLSHSSSSQEIAVLFMACIVFNEDLQYYLWSIYLRTQAIASNPPKYYTGRQISMTEYEAEGESCTQKALEGLKTYLAAHPEETNKYMDMFREADKMTEAQVLLRFVHHGYSGRPSKESRLLVGRQSKINWFKLVLIFSLTICVAAISLSALTGSQVLTRILSRISKQVV